MKYKALSIIFALLMVILLLLPGLAPAAAEDDDVLPERLHFVNALDANVCTERIVYEVFKRLGVEVSISIENMDIGLRGVNAGVYDGICNQTKGVEESYDQLVRIPVETSICHFYALTMESDPFVCDSWEDLAGKRVGSLSGKPFVRGALSETVASYIERPSLSLLYAALQAGECDVVIIADTSDKAADQLVIPAGIRIAGITDTHSCSIFLNKKHAGLVDAITRELDNMEKDGSLARLKAMKPLDERNEKIVLYLSSYSSELLWEQSLLEGIGYVLDQHLDIVYHNIALNSYRNTDQALLEISALSTLSIDFLHSPPDAVIVSDNEAMNFLMCNYNAILPNDIPIIYCGLNNRAVAAAQRYGDYMNLQGIVEPISAADTVEQMLKLFPATEEIYVINDYTRSGQRWRGEIETQLAPLDGRIRVRYNDNLSFEALLAEVAALGDTALILTGSYYLDRDNRYFPQPSFQSELAEASPAPIFGLLDTSQGFGQVGGKYTDATLHGAAAASMAVEILRSDNFSEFTYVERDQDNRWVFDLNIMKKYGLREDQLPRGATILNAPVSLRQAHPVLFYGMIVAAAAGVVIILLLAAFIIVLKKRNQRLVAAENAILKSHSEVEAVRNHLQTILETAPIAYSLLVDDVVVESNRYFNENIGLVAGQKNADKYDDDERAHYNKLMKECRKKGFVGSIPWYIIKTNGRKVRYLYNIARSTYEGQEAIVMWGVEIEQLERQKDALNRAYADLQAMIENAPLSIALICPDEQTILLANPAWRTLFRIPESLDTNGILWSELGSLSPRPVDEFIQQAMESNAPVSNEWVFNTYDGENFDAIMYLRKIVYGGKDCVIVSYRDLREEKARERMLKSAAEKEREASRLKSHFLMNMSHEIRTPMNAIIGISQLAEPKDDAAALYDSITKIGHSASVLLNIINDVLDLSLIEDGKMVLQPEEVRISDLIDDLDAVVAVEMGKKRITRSVDLGGVIHNTVIVDPSRLQQAIIALATNAVKFTGEGGKISLTVKETPGTDGMSTFEFSIRDTGIGIEADRMDRLFKPFEQADDGITRQHGGAGLGLSIAKNIVELMGGNIWAESEVGVGSTFYLTIAVPVCPGPVNTAAKADKDGDAPPADAAPAAIHFPGIRVLLVDDVEINRLIAVEVLTKLGCVTEEAENGRQAVEMLQSAAPGHYDLVFMDVQMPVLDGCSATREIRALGRPDLKILPIVAMTAHVMPDDIQMVLDAGMNGHVGKPIFMEQLVEAIEANVPRAKA